MNKKELQKVIVHASSEEPKKAKITLGATGTKNDEAMQFTIEKDFGKYFKLNMTCNALKTCQFTLNKQLQRENRHDPHENGRSADQSIYA